MGLRLIIIVLKAS